MKAQICPLLGSPFPKTEVAMKAVLQTNPMRLLFTFQVSGFRFQVSGFI